MTALEKVLSSHSFHFKVSMARKRLDLRMNDVSEAKAEEHHNALLATFAGHHQDIQLGTGKKPVLQFWGQLIRETRALCPLLDLDPEPLDRRRSVFGTGGVDLLIGLRKLINQEGILRFAGRGIRYQPSPTDRLMAHLLWGLPLSAKDIVQRPGVSYKWARLPDGGGAFAVSIFGLDPYFPFQQKMLATL